MNATVCQFCSGPIKTPHPNRRYCSDRCKAAANRKSFCSCGAIKSKQARRCLRCSLDARQETRSKKRQRIEYLWGEGLTTSAIGAEVGLTAPAIQIEITRMRGTGWHVPHRRKPRSTEDPATQTDCREKFHGALEFGQIRRPTRCEECGEVGYVDGHHTDYSRPLFVYWLCRTCHMALHREEQVAA